MPVIRRFYGIVMLQVVLLPDVETVHNAFLIGVSDDENLKIQNLQDTDALFVVEGMAAYVQQTNYED